MRHPVVDEALVLEQLLCTWREMVERGDRPRALAEARAHLERLCKVGLPYDERDDGRWFDPIDLNFITERGRTHGDPFWNEHVVPTRRRMTQRYAPASPPTSRYHDPRPLTLRIERALAFPRPPGTRVIVTMPVPRNEPSQRELRVTTTVEDGHATLEDGFVAVRVKVGQDGRVRFSVQIDCIAYQQTITVDPARVAPPGDHGDPELAPYLAWEDGEIVRVTPAVEAMAARIRRPGRWETVIAAWETIFDERVIGSLNHYELDPNDPLGSAGKWVDCYIVSALFVAMLRVCGIAARIVMGALSYPSGDQGHHYWSEVWVPPYGWVPADFLSWSLAFGKKSDLKWSRHLLGHLPYQLSTLCLPRTRMELGPRYPARWYSASVIRGTGQENRVYDLDSGALIICDVYESTLGAHG